MGTIIEDAKFIEDMVINDYKNNCLLSDDDLEGLKKICFDNGIIGDDIYYQELMDYYWVCINKI